MYALSRFKERENPNPQTPASQPNFLSLLQRGRQKLHVNGECLRDGEAAKYHCYSERVQFTSASICKAKFTSAATTEELLEQLSWNLRLKIWSVNQSESFGSDSNVSPPPQFDFAVPTEVSDIGAGGRRVGIQSLVNRRTGSTIVPNVVDSGDENKMRLKLFRLMYETVRDSDLKVKRAELVQKNYDVFPAFKVGMFMGDLQDKYTVMTDIASTLKKFHSVWKPIEHINAYEQIANAGIEISQLIEHLRAAGKHAEKEREQHSGPPLSPPTPPGQKSF